MFLQLCWRFQYHYKCDKSLKSAYCGLLRFKYQSSLIPKADWCLGLMIKSIIIRSGRYRLKLNKKKNSSIIYCRIFLNYVLQGGEFVKDVYQCFYFFLISKKIILKKHKRTKTTQRIQRGEQKEKKEKKRKKRKHKKNNKD